MDIKIQSIHFEATEKLQAFVEKKVSKLAKFSEDVNKVEVLMKVVKPEAALNKEVSIKVSASNGEMFAEKTCDTFEEAVDLCLDALTRQLSKYKEKQKSH